MQLKKHMFHQFQYIFLRQQIHCSFFNCLQIMRSDHTRTSGYRQHHQWDHASLQSQQMADVSVPLHDQNRMHPKPISPSVVRPAKQPYLLLPHLSSAFLSTWAFIRKNIQHHWCQTLLNDAQIEGGKKGENLLLREAGQAFRHTGCFGPTRVHGVEPYPFAAINFCPFLSKRHLK